MSLLCPREPRPSWADQAHFLIVVAHASRWASLHEPADQIQQLGPPHPASRSPGRPVDVDRRSRVQHRGSLHWLVITWHMWGVGVAAGSCGAGWPLGILVGGWDEGLGGDDVVCEGEKQGAGGEPQKRTRAPSFPLLSCSKSRLPPRCVVGSLACSGLPWGCPLKLSLMEPLATAS